MYALDVPQTLQPERVLKKRFRQILCVPSLSMRRIVRRDPCSYCGKRGGTVDHIKPKSKGGTLTHTNVTGACSKCNVRKGKLKLLLYLVKRWEKEAQDEFGLANPTSRREEVLSRAANET